MKYSVFISYRRDQSEDVLQKKLMNNLKKMLESVAGHATDVAKVFFDEDSIKWGEEFDEKIYNCIVSSCFFIPIYYDNYLSVKKLWCARELYHAIEVEKMIRDKTSTKFCFILPLIRYGDKNLPECIYTKNAKSLHVYITDIINNQPSKKHMDFRKEIYNTLQEHHNNVKDISEEDIIKWCEGIVIPSDEILKEWIKEKNQEMRRQEETKTPKIQKYAK